MDIDLEPSNTPRQFQIGQPLDDLSVDEIEKTIVLLGSEIERLSAAKTSKASHLSAAEALFSKP